MIARSAHTDAVDRPVTIQWKFEDAEPYHLRIDNGSTSAAPGLADKPDVTLKTTWADWIESRSAARTPAGRCCGGS